MQKKFLIILAITILALPGLVFSATAKKTTKTKAKTVPQIRILIVPGHDNEIWGAQYGNIKEAEMTRVLATQIYNILAKDKRFKVYITRNSAGYTKTFSNYFSKNQKAILAFKADAKAKMKENITTGDFTAVKGVPHMSVKPQVAEHLYGINKWANENKIDAVIHVHFDDEGRNTYWDLGAYKGFTVYYPDAQLPNGVESKNLAQKIFNQLKTKYSTSTYDKEMGGFKSDQTLIALGANASLDKGVRSVLMEYGYIYEKMFRKSSTRHQAYKTMADLTAKGIKNYFTSP